MDTMETTAATAAALTIRTDLIAGAPSLAHLAGPKGPALHSLARRPGGSKRTRPTLPHLARSAALAALVRDDVLAVALLAGQIFLERRLRVRVHANRARRDMKRLEEHVGILDGGLPPDGVPGAGVLLDHSHVVAVEPPRPPDPALVVEADDVDDKRVAFPLADGVAVPRGVLRLDRIVRAPVDRDDAELVALRVEQDHFRWCLDDLGGRPHPRHACRLAVEGRIFLDALAIEVLHALPEFRLVHRGVLLGRRAVLRRGVERSQGREGGDRERRHRTRGGPFRSAVARHDVRHT